MPDPAITVRALHKRYGQVEAVRGIDLTVQRGEVFSLLGPNGAGKTTTVEILEGHRDRDAGEVRVLGHDPQRRERALRERIGIVLQAPAVEPYLTVAETIDLFRGYYPHPRGRDEVLELVGLAEQRDVRVRRLSGGQQRRLDVAIGLAGDPDLLFLDEPTTGFDPSARRQSWGMVRNLRELGKTVLLTTHYLDEAQELSDRVAILARGRLVAEGTPDELRRRQTGTRISFRIPPAERSMVEGLEDATVDTAGRVLLRSDEPTRLLHELAGRALARGIELDELAVSRASLEDVYLSLAGDGGVLDDGEHDGQVAGP